MKASTRADSRDQLRAIASSTLPGRIAQASLLALPIVFLAVGAWQRRWITDDGFIDLRIVDHLLRGNGPVFNAGERVEAYTNALWVAILALWGLGGGRLEIGAIFLGILFATCGVGLAQATAARLWRTPTLSTPPTLLPFGALIFVILPPVWDFTTSGLEMGLAFGWFGLCGWLLTRLSETRRHSLFAALIIGLGPLIRPDFALFSAALLAAHLFITYTTLSHPRIGRLLPPILAAMALPVAYQIFRMGYFAAIWPNTLIAKEAGGSRWPQGFAYLLDFMLPYLLMLPLSLTIPLGYRLIKELYARHEQAKLAIVVAFFGSALAHGALVLRVGGDYMHGRLLLPALFALLLPVMVIKLPTLDIASRRQRALSRCALVSFSLWILGCALFARVPYAGAVTVSGISDERGVFTAITDRDNPVFIEDYSAATVARRGLALREWSKGRATLVENTEECPLFAEESPSATCSAIIAALPGPLPIAPWIAPEIRIVALHHVLGVVGYQAGPQAFIVDRMGLADPIASRLQMPTRGRPGHEKWLTNAWYLARFSTPVADEAATVTAARAALACGELATLHEALTAPMTPTRFVQNLRQSWTLTHLAVPRDPIAAQAQFCNETSPTGP